MSSFTLYIPSAAGRTLSVSKFLYFSVTHLRENVKCYSAGFSALLNRWVATIKVVSKTTPTPP